MASRDVMPGYTFRWCETCKRDTSQKIMTSSTGEKFMFCNKHKGPAKQPKEKT